jgi:hypothetical protein
MAEMITIPQKGLIQLRRRKATWPVDAGSVSFQSNPEGLESATSEPACSSPVY